MHFLDIEFSCVRICVCVSVIGHSHSHCQLPQDGGATKGEASFRRPERIRAAEPEDMRRDSECGCGVSCTIGSRCLGTDRKSFRDLVGETKACRLRAIQLINSPKRFGNDGECLPTVRFQPSKDRRLSERMSSNGSS